MSYLQKILSYNLTDKKNIKKLLILGVIKKVVFALVFLYASNANALSLYYDAQLEDYLNKMAAPLKKSSGLRDVRFYIASSNQINAFATENKEIVLYSGLIEKSKTKQQVQGVLAHELGHLIAQHHVKSRVKHTDSGFNTIAGTILGVGAIIAGAPQAGYAAIVGGGAADMSKSLAHSRTHENEADSIAIKLLDENNISKKGLADFFKLLERQENNFYKDNPEYLSTHPSTSNRKSFITANITNDESIKNDEDFDIFKAKIFALTNKAEKVINYYSVKEDSAATSLALAIGYAAQNDFSKAFKQLDKSKKLGLKDIWYYDMLGQMMYQKADFEESVSFYTKSRDLGNNSWILDFQIAESLYALKNKKALDYYFKAVSKFEYFYYTYKRIADVYAQQKEMSKAYVYLTIYNLKTGKTKDAKRYYALLEKQIEKDNVTDPVVLQQLADFKQYFKLEKESK